MLVVVVGGNCWCFSRCCRSCQRIFSCNLTIRGAAALPTPIDAISAASRVSPSFSISSLPLLFSALAENANGLLSKWQSGEFLVNIDVRERELINSRCFLADVYFFPHTCQLRLDYSCPTDFYSFQIRLCEQHTAYVLAGSRLSSSQQILLPAPCGED